MINSCKTKQDLKIDKNSLLNNSNNDFKNITNEKYLAVVNNDTISINQIKYNYVYSAFLLNKIMFDKFGKWDEARFKKNERHPVLVWKNVQLFPNHETNYMIATYGGGEEDHKIYTSVMVFDEDGKDLLAGNLTLRNDVNEYFTELIRKNDENKKKFYSIYWRDVDPDFYKKYIK